MEFDWSPYFGGLELWDLLYAGFLGALGLAPLLVFRLGYMSAVDLLRRVTRLLVGR